MKEPPDEVVFEEEYQPDPNSAEGKAIARIRAGCNEEDWITIAHAGELVAVDLDKVKAWYERHNIPFNEADWTD